MVGSMIPNKPFDGEMMTLLEWISSRGSSQSLEQLADSCYRSLQQMDPDLLVDLKSKVAVAIEGSHNSQMKEIRGLGTVNPRYSFHFKSLILTSCSSDLKTRSP